jgi:predicted metalloendopeptidase
MALPDRDYYLNQDAKSREIRTKYRENIVKMMKIAGESAKEAASTADFVLKFETALAEHALPKDDRRDTAKLFHPMSFTELKALAPAFDWETYFQALGIAIPQKINVSEPDFLRNVSSLLLKTQPRDLARYLKWETVRHLAYYVDGPLRQENFRFWSVYLEGAKELPPRWKYCTRIISDEMSEALGQAYVQSIAGATDIRAKTEAMLAEIRVSFLENLGTLNWMDSSTRENARKKLEKMGKKVGWPDHWRDYSKLELEPHAFLEDVMRSLQFEERRNLAKIDKPTDRSEWFMATWEPNAYYQDSNNELVLPLGELVPPIFDPHFSDGANYGSLGGGTIGHELTHGFDDSGKDKDADGNFVTWWTPKTKELFDTKSACFVQQTEKYEILPGSGVHIRGKATLGENLADNGGVKLGLIALKKAIQARGKPAPEFAGLNEIQQYFLAYGQSWCVKTTEEHLRDQLLTDFHPPAEFRVNGVLSNQPEFAEAFGCRAGSKMAPVNRCSIW